MQHIRSVTLLSLLTAVTGIGCGMNQIGFLEAETGDLSLGDAPRATFDESLAAACGHPEVAVMESAALPAFLRPPYLQQVTDTGAHILWTSADGPASVTVSDPDGTVVAEVTAEIDASAPLPEGDQYVARIDGLAASQVYCYQIRGAGGALASASFRTAPNPGSDTPVRFVAFGDLGVGDLDQWEVLRQLGTVELDLALITGDVAYESGRLSDLEANFFDVYAPLLRHIPFFPASGNHDYETADAAPFRQVFALPENSGEAGRERWYSLDWGMIHVAVIDTEILSEEQVDWLDADLGQTDQPWTIVVGHRPPYSAGDHGSDLAVRALFMPVLERHAVDLTLWGHDHHYERIDAGDGIAHIVSGAGGRGTRPVGTTDVTVFADQVSHFVYGIATKDELRLWAIDAAGNTFDTLLLTR